MSKVDYRYSFASSIPVEEIDATFALAIIGVASLHGEAEVRLDAAHSFDARQRTSVIDASTPVGRDLNRLFVSYLTREFGDGSFQVERVSTDQNGTFAGNFRPEMNGARGMPIVSDLRH